MALSALYLLAAIVSTLLPSYTGTLHRLAIHYASAWLRIPFDADAQTLAQGSVQPLPGAVDPPSSEVMVYGLPGRKVVRQKTPGTATTDDVEDGVKDLAQGVYSGTSRSFRGRDMGFYVRPFGTGQVGLVCCSHARYSTELLSQDPFSDSFRRSIPGNRASGIGWGFESPPFF